ncbi:MAG: uroporphyrinogen decarboxylase family protein [Defluviitaleaceae bacterium]|nr:uroporphyrinogen decarboxylase family protein [Defluviitaleaceae bacterium]
MNVGFDFDKYLLYCENNNKKARGFFSGGFLPVNTWTLGKNTFAVNSRDAELMLSEQLAGISETMEEYNDWIPYLEPWHGVGVFAEAFGCPFEWNDYDAPWTRTVVKDIEGLKRLKKPELKNSKMLQYVLRTTEYFNEQTRGQVYISATDTQSPVDNLTLIADPTWFLTEAWDYPREFHRVLSNITDLMIEFTLEQRALCAKPAAPGHTTWSPDIFGGVSVSEDVMVMMGPDFYNEFAKPYNERFAEATGGIAIHSCGKWAHSFKAAQDTRGIVMADLSVSKIYDPDPNIPEKIISGFGDGKVPVQVRADYADIKLIDELLGSDAKLILVLWRADSQADRERQYNDIKERWAKKRKK